jgi:hypothetical protein
LEGVAASAETVDATPPPLPLRIAGRHAPAAPLARRRPRRDDPAAAPAGAAPAASASSAPAPAAPPAVAAEVEEPPAPDAPEAQPPVAPAADGAFRRTALAEFTALASSSGDDFSFRRR